MVNCQTHGIYIYMYMYVYKEIFGTIEWYVGETNSWGSVSDCQDPTLADEGNFYQNDAYRFKLPFGND